MENALGTHFVESTLRRKSQCPDYYILILTDLKRIEADVQKCLLFLKKQQAGNFRNAKH